MSNEALEKAKSWVKNTYFSKESIDEIRQLLNNNNLDEITDRFYKTLEFGTGGIRGVIGAGENRMNIYNIRKATQALATALNTSFKSPSVAISYDSRHFSIEFARETAAVLVANNIKVFIYKRLNPVCLLSYSVRYHKAQAGVMITASHNPPQYNGYKVYWDDGAQVVAPHDQNIIDAYNDITDYNTIKSMPFEKAEQSGMITWVGEDVENSYQEKIRTKVINPQLCRERGTELKFVYTPIHGTGLIPCTTALRSIGLTNFLIVEEQAKPDGDFPTVKSPNPENPEALDLAVKLMQKENADIAFGTDPDADRIGIAVTHNDEIYYLSGNQIGTMLFHYVACNLKKLDKMPVNPYMVKTIVTTRLQDKIGAHFGIDVYNTLTDFKWICGKMREIEQTNPSSNFLFGTEESFGYLNHNFVRDKDGVGPIMLLAEMSLHYKIQGKTLIDGLNDIYTQFGFYHESLLNLNYYGKEGGEKIQRIMNFFRNETPKDICGDNIAIVEDYQLQNTHNLKTNTITKIDIPKSNVLGFIMDSGNILYLRPSGTEPKIKFYLLFKDDEGSLPEMKQRAIEKSNQVIEYIKSTTQKI